MLRAVVPPLSSLLPSSRSIATVSLEQFRLALESVALPLVELGERKAIHSEDLGELVVAQVRLHADGEWRSLLQTHRH